MVESSSQQIYEEETQNSLQNLMQIAVSSGTKTGPSFEQYDQLHALEAGPIRFISKQSKANGSGDQSPRGFKDLPSFQSFEVPFSRYQINAQDLNDPALTAHEKKKISMQIGQQVSQNKDMGESKYYVGAHGQPIKIGKLDTSKQICVIYNPNSGKKRDIRKDLSQMFISKNLKHTFYETQGYLDAWRFVQNCDLSDLACIVAVGGDGTIHEVVNGLMYRADGGKVPLCFIPNGSGNDTCHSLGVTSIETALEGLSKGYFLQVDLIRCLMDANSVDELDTVEDKTSRMRYSISSAACGFLAKTTHKAADYKSWAGSSCYLFAGLHQLVTGGEAESYKVTIQNQLKSGEICNYVRYTQSHIMCIMNARYCGGKIPLMPAAIMNDGLLDFSVYQVPVKFSKVPSLYSEVISKHGRHVYQQNEWDYARGQSALIENLNHRQFESKKLGSPPPPQLAEQLFQVDGEGLKFTRNVRMDVLCKVLPVVLDTEMILGLKPLGQ